MNKDINIAKQTIQTEIKGLKKLLKSFNHLSQFSKAVNLISKAHKGKVVVVGTGKSFIIGNKISSSLSSLGTASVCFDSSALNHGSMGSIQKGDILLIFSVSGETSELNSILRFSNRNNIPVVGVSCKASSMLLRFSSIPILLPRVVEAGLSLAPTSSQINFLSFGDALSIALSKRKKFSNKHFVNLHPHGQLGSALVLVKEIMAKGKEIPLISSKETMKDLIGELTRKGLGMICVQHRNAILLATDGDLRRYSNNLYKKKILQVCSKNPTWISETATALSGIEKMSSLKITSLLCTPKQYIKKRIKKITGVLHMHHCLSRGIK